MSEGGRAVSSRPERWPSGGAEVLKGPGLGGYQEEGPGRGVYPGVKTHSSRTAVDWTPVHQVGAARRPVHHLRFVDTLPLQKGVTKEADVLQKAAWPGPWLARADTS